MIHDLRYNCGHDLPGKTELVLEPAAVLSLAALGEPIPEEIDLFLGRAIDL